MSYNTVDSAKALVGQTVTQELLNVARSIIDQHSEFRWEATTKVWEFAGMGEKYIYLVAPIVSVATVKVDFGSGTKETKVENTDYYVRKDIGELYYPGGLPSLGYDNVEITYTYGFTPSDVHYHTVRMVEAQIAMYLKRNPGMLRRIGVEGATMEFGTAVSGKTEGLSTFLSLVPVPLDPIGI